MNHIRAISPTSPLPASKDEAALRFQTKQASLTLKKTIEIARQHFIFIGLFFLIFLLSLGSAHFAYHSSSPPLILLTSLVPLTAAFLINDKIINSIANIAANSHQLKNPKWQKRQIKTLKECNLEKIALKKDQPYQDSRFSKYADAGLLNAHDAKKVYGFAKKYFELMNQSGNTDAIIQLNVNWITFRDQLHFPEISDIARKGLLDNIPKN